MKDLDISVVIPNYNGVGLFPEILPSLFEALEHSGKAYEVIVADDCSTDNSVTWLKANYPGITVLSSAENTGFAPAVNRGIRASVHSLVFIMNSDVKLAPDYFESQFAYFADNDTFGVSGQIIGWTDDTVQDGQKYPEFHLFKFKTSKNLFPGREKRFQNEEAKTAVSGNGMPPIRFYTSYLSGANTLAAREKLLILGGFDEIYAPFYSEDTDLSVRAWRMGWKCYYEPSAVCRHKVSVSIRSKVRKSGIRTIYNRNKFYFHAIHLSGFFYAGWMAQTILELLFRLITFRWDYVRSFAAFCRNYGLVRQSKKRFKALTRSEGKNFSLPYIVRTIRSAANRRPGVHGQAPNF